MNIKHHLRNHIFFYIIILCIVIMAFVSFSRFIINNDYFVYYEGTCDPYVNSCFEICEEDECTYYTKVQKYASDIHNQCGVDITGCELSDMCLSSDKECSITYCDKEIDDNCKTFNADSIIN